MRLGKNISHKIIIIAVVAISFLVLFVSPQGLITTNPTTVQGLELLQNSDFTDGDSQWEHTEWRSQGGRPSIINFANYPSSVTMSLTGSDNSFYAVGLCQGGGPNSLWHGHVGNLEIAVDHDKGYVVTWRGSVDNSSVQEIGCLGIGVNAWFDVELADGSGYLPFEIFVFIYQEGVYSLPLGTFKDYGYRGGYWYETILENNHDQIERPWRYFYFHPIQFEKGVVSEYRFNLNDYIDIMREKCGEPYQSGKFVLQRVGAVMELFMAEATFAIDKLSLIEGTYI